MNRLLFSFILCWGTIFTSTSQSLLADWEGVYEGMMIVGINGRPNDSVQVSFEFMSLKKDSVWSYRMTYTSDTHDTVVKDYLLKRVEDSKVNFLLDEKNGIIIEMSFMNDCFYSMFEVLDNMYTSTLRKSDEGIFFDLFSSNMDEGSLTQSQSDSPDTIFEVTSYKPGLHQTVQFNRISTN